MATITAPRGTNHLCDVVEHAHYDMARKAADEVVAHWRSVSGYLESGGAGGADPDADPSYTVPALIARCTARERGEVAAPFAAVLAGVSGVISAATGVMPVPVAIVGGFALGFGIATAILAGGRWPRP